jgi:hypothetical protein
MSQVAPLGRRMRQSPAPGHATSQAPAAGDVATAEPVQAKLLWAPTSTMHGPEPLQLTAQESPQMKSHAPGPAHCRSQLPLQSIR